MNISGSEIIRMSIPQITRNFSIRLHGDIFLSTDSPSAVRFPPIKKLVLVLVLVLVIVIEEYFFHHGESSAFVIVI